MIFIFLVYILGAEHVVVNLFIIKKGLALNKKISNKTLDRHLKNKLISK